jgi:predicted nuclease with TOPRIM domain
MDEVAELRQQLADVTGERNTLRNDLAQMTTFRDNASSHMMRLRNEVTRVEEERDLLARRIADAACKLGITSEGVALTGPHLLMLLGDMVGVSESLFKQLELCRKQRECR